MPMTVGLCICKKEFITYFPLTNLSIDQTCGMKMIYINTDVLRIKNIPNQRAIFDNFFA